MKDQNKNQETPEAKLTDAQLGEVNAGIGMTIDLANTARTQIANTQACATKQLANEANKQGFFKLSHEPM